jgi:hypothetical protein
MIKRYLLASFLGGLIGASCVLVIVHVTNTKALTIHDAGLEPAVNALHSRINDFYIFAGIVITLLLAINVGVFIQADEEVDRQIKKGWDKHQSEVIALTGKCSKLFDKLTRLEKETTKNAPHNEFFEKDIDSEL